MAPPAAPGGFAPLATERLTLRPYRPEDAAELHRLINDWEVCRTLAAVPFPYSRKLAEEWIGSTQASLAAGTALHLAITGQEGAQEVLVGGAGLRIDTSARTARLGYWVGRRFWGHGVASEAAKRLAHWALANLELDRLEATVATDNPGSIAVLRRIGFRHVGEGVETFVARGGEQRVLRFEATRGDLFGHPETDPAADGSLPLLLVAACALVDTDGRVLLARRPEGKKMAGLWEFPGGKLNPGETPEAALIRELKEELGIDVASACLAPFAFASHAYDRFHLLMPLFLCRRWRGTPTAREGQLLAWVRPDRLTEYRMPEADLPLVPLLRDFL
ncbi:MAG: GNAT family N-acetyltransferase [Acetobacteraceae bacterium SCN 69-10]|nr:MAG: GNAT family N-acetyltransferase [Acetobacteraceae bacterium SCN 69-10]OJY77485.1 MAG: GNAT family N-acetyltransferase [Rhodospirillales bacterium 70-18]